jgi:hypothetical protein
MAFNVLSIATAFKSAREAKNDALNAMSKIATHLRRERDASPARDGSEVEERKLK